MAAANLPAQTFFSANLTNSQENPPTNPTLSTGGARATSFGTATFILNSAQTSMTFSATISNIDFTGSQTPDSNDNLTAAHIHAGATVAPGVNGGVVWGFFGAPFNDNSPNDVVITPFANGVGGTISGKWDAPEGNNTTLAAQLPNILAGRSYINFHTTQFGGGEIRGTLLPAPGITTSAALPAAILGTAYSQTLAGSGGTAPLSWSLSSGTLPAGLALSNTGVLSGTPTAVGTSSFAVKLTDSTAAFAIQNFTLTVLPAGLNFTSGLKIAQVVDGGNFVTQFGILNLEQTPVSFQVRFWGDNGAALNLPLVNGAPGTIAGTLAPGGTAFTQTAGTSAPLVQGWAEVASTGRVQVVAVLRVSPAGGPDSEATVLATPAVGSTILPFDNTQGFVTGLALSNADPSQAATVLLTFTPENGTPSTASVSIGPLGHTAFVLPTTFASTAGARGSVRFSSSNNSLAVVALRFSPKNSFTSLGSSQ